VIDEALRRDPRSLPALGLAAATSLQGGDIERATGYVERITQAAPGSPIAHQMEGDLAMAQKRYRDALAAYEKADPALKNRSIVMARYSAAQLAKVPQPEKVLEQWIAAHPDDAGAVGMIAERKRSGGDLTGAAQMYEQAITKASGSAVLHNNLAMIYIETGDPRALPTAEKAYQLLPKAPPIQDTYGWALLKSGKADKAVEVLAEAAKGMPDNAEVQYHYAAALVAAGKKSEALPFARKAVAGSLPPAVRAEATKLLSEIQ
jgi:predicted Zn-dependent protease